MLKRFFFYLELRFNVIQAGKSFKSLTLALLFMKKNSYRKIHHALTFSKQSLFSWLGLIINVMYCILLHFFSAFCNLFYISSDFKEETSGSYLDSKLHSNQVTSLKIKKSFESSRKREHLISNFFHSFILTEITNCTIIIHSTISQAIAAYAETQIQC